MLSALLTFLGCLVLVAITQRWWKSYLNPVSWGVLAWTPALVMANFPLMFVSPVYIHQNRPFSLQVFMAMGLGFLSFWAGCAVMKALSGRDAFRIDRPWRETNVHLFRLLGVFSVGFGMFLYTFITSGLIGVSGMDQIQVAESRLALHVGPISFITLLMDLAAVGFYARFLQTGRWLYAVPIAVALIAYMFTLQKSPVVWIAIAAIFVSALHPREFRDLFLRKAASLLALVGAIIGTLVGLAATNAARGISDANMTTASSSLAEQWYIYSGATAIKNLSVTIEGYLPSDGPTLGAYLARPVLWNFVDRDMFAAGRYLEGINAATYLNMAWIDFRWAGFVISPFLTGIMVMLFIRQALSGSLLGLVLGAIAARSVVFSIGTDVMFEPVTWYTIILAVVADFLARQHGPTARRAKPSHSPRVLPVNPARYVPRPPTV